MLRPPQSLLAALLSTTVVVTVALVWAGWRLLDQQRAIDEQRARLQIEAAADVAAAGIRGKLAEAGERLSGWVSDPSSAIPAVEGAVVVAIRTDAIAINPPGGLPYVPTTVPDARAGDGFSRLEAIEFSGGESRRAADGYRALAATADPHTRAGALLRLGRVLRKSHDFAGALVAYRQLADLGSVRTDDLPAELAGLDGQRSTLAALGSVSGADHVAARILAGLDGGRWLLVRGTAEFYRDGYPQPRPESWTLANTLSDLWAETDGRLSPRGQRIFYGTGPGTTRLAVWRSNGTHTAALVTRADRFLDVVPSTVAQWQLVDPEGRVIGGNAIEPTRSVARIIGNSEYPWTLRLSSVAAAAPAAPGSRAILLTMMGAMLLFVWGASYFMTRAIRREAAVARLQSDFVAAVSHEFRSPLTTVRQMAEMLDADRVPTTERRHQYYKILAGEASRLQRLVETLLNFGRMEAGAECYRFVDVDAAAVVRDVVADIEAHARDCGKAIEIEGAEAGIRILADESALAVAVRNLIDNAIKYSPDQPTVWVRCRKDQDRAAIAVVDRGVGIPRSEHQTIFRKFVRGRAAIDANIKGTGVGLSMVQQIVAAHGGEILVDSEPGRGSTFTMWLPAVS